LTACNNETKSDSKDESKSKATGKATMIKVQPGFHAEHLYSPYDSGTGSWVSMTFDDKGRMICSDQYGALYRLIIPPIGADTSKEKVKVEKIQFDIESADDESNKVRMGFAQGLVWAFNSLYCVVNHPAKDSTFAGTSGFYRLQDTDGDDAFDKITLLKTLVGEEEHGPHSIKLAPDGKSFYIIAGNNTDLPEKLTASRPPQTWKLDNLLSGLNRVDPRARISAGWIAKVDSAGKNWELIGAGLRNPFDLAFNEAGELFTYDSDMEWDIGMAWYRPTRICHVTSGADFGFREGTGKWAPSYLDNLPPVLNIGQGSPTNLVSLADARFPKSYANTILASDWSFGIMYAIHLTPDGATYKGTAEEFLSGAPLPLTDGVVGPDGGLYFLTGGRRLSSDLYRVYYEDNKSKTVREQNAAPEITEAAKTRKKLEELHLKQDPAAIDFAWPYLKDSDRFIRFAARIAIEKQPVAQWQEKALNEKDPVAATHALIALARHGNSNLKSRIFKSLMSIDYNSLSLSQKKDLARTFEVTMYRMGKPDAAETKTVSEYLAVNYPSDNNDLNRILGKILSYVNDPSFVSKTLPLLDVAKDDTTEQPTVSASSDLILRNPQYGMDLADILSKTPPAQQMYYSILLSNVSAGWTDSDREKYFKWIYKAFGYKGGREVRDFMNAAKKEALSHVPKEKYKYYDSISTNKTPAAAAIDWVRVMSDGGPGRQWKLQAALDTVAVLENRDYQNAKAMFTAAACVTCHTIGGEGGAIGPDLTQLGTRFSKRDILESIIEPNKVISDQYASTVFTLKDTKSIIGKLVKDENGKYYISQNPFALDQLKEIKKSDVVSIKTADVSLMPPLLINNLNPERLRDLMAYLVSGGNPKNEVFKQSDKVAEKK
ncbi:MAG: c-type cytochrome, partial [Chitinophagaceae bacterium]|nr:c-type cytochrome [Chitinophagaceae bacterium]